MSKFITNIFDFIVFTNSDIGLQKEFYRKIYDFIVNGNLESFIINRRDGLPKFRKAFFKKNYRLTENNLTEIYKERGFKHPGKDCFIFSREILEQIDMNLMFTGYPPWGRTLYFCLQKKDKKCKLFKNEYLTFHIGKDECWKENEENPLRLKNKELSEIVLNNI